MMQNIKSLFRTINKLLIIFLTGSIFIPLNASQPDTLFLSDEVINMELRADYLAVQRDRDLDPMHHRGKLTYFTPSGDSVKLTVRVMTRGNFRLNPDNCKFPPLLIDFKKGEVKNTLFRNQNTLKLVTPCQSEEEVIKEYLIYKMYNKVTDLSMRVRLVKISYYDERLHKELFNRYSFFIEDKDHAAERNDLAARDMFVTPFDIDHENMKKLSVFQYLIGNKDWFISSRKNIVIMQSRDSSSVYAVPFDFDLAGFVDADYAKPKGVPESMLSDKRIYKGVCYSPGELSDVFSYFMEIKPDLESVVNDQELVPKTIRKQMLQYLNDSYSVFENNELVRQKFLTKCETRKDYNLPQ